MVVARSSLELQARAKLLVYLRAVHGGEPLFVPVRGNGLSHPLGREFKQAASVNWVAAYLV